MKANLAINITDIEGNNMQENGKELILSKIIGNNLFISEDKEDPIRLADLAKKIYYSEGEIELSSSDIQLIKDKVKEKGFTVLILAPLFNCLKEK